MLSLCSKNLYVDGILANDSFRLISMFLEFLPLRIDSCYFIGCKIVDDSFVICTVDWERPPLRRLVNAALDSGAVIWFE